MTKDDLNAALMEAIAQGHRPFLCFGCGEWFIQLKGLGRKREVCDDPWCQRQRQAWTRTGRRPDTSPERILKGYRSTRKVVAAEVG